MSELSAEKEQNAVRDRKTSSYVIIQERYGQHKVEKKVPVLDHPNGSSIQQRRMERFACNGFSSEFSLRSVGVRDVRI